MLKPELANITTNKNCQLKLNKSISTSSSGSVNE